MVERISTTASAIELIEELTAKHGPVVFLQSGGCCEGSGPLCMPANEFHPNSTDVVIGELAAGAVFYMSHSHFQFSQNTHTILDAVVASSGSFSLDCGTGRAFITRGRLFTDEELAELKPAVCYGDK